MGLLTAALAAVVLLQPVNAFAQADGGRFESQTWGIRISAPEGWRISTQASYPQVLAWMFRATDRGKMLLAAERLSDNYSPVQYVARTAAQLAALGYRVEAEPQLHAATSALWIEFDDDRTFYRQAFLIKQETVYSLTLAAPDRDTRSRHLRSFDAALRSLQLSSNDVSAADGDASATPVEGDVNTQSAESQETPNSDDDASPERDSERKLPEPGNLPCDLE